MTHSTIRIFPVAWPRKARRVALVAALASCLVVALAPQVNAAPAPRSTTTTTVAPYSGSEEYLEYCYGDPCNALLTADHQNGLLSVDINTSHKYQPGLGCGWGYPFINLCYPYVDRARAQGYGLVYSSQSLTKRARSISTTIAVDTSDVYAHVDAPQGSEALVSLEAVLYHRASTAIGGRAVETSTVIASSASPPSSEPTTVYLTVVMSEDTVMMEPGEIRVTIRLRGRVSSLAGVSQASATAKVSSISTTITS